jgi:hypothetical protein
MRAWGNPASSGEFVGGKESNRFERIKMWSFRVGKSGGFGAFRADNAGKTPIYHGGKMCRRMLQVFNRSFDIDLLAVEPSFDFDVG